MRRNDREIQDINDILDILSSGSVCHMGIHDNDFPYVIPLSYGMNYENNTITFYFHCAKDGKKIELLRHNPKVCIEVDTDSSLICADYPCGHTMAYSSVIAYGIAEFISDEKEKCQALNYIMEQYTDNEEMRLVEGSTQLSHIRCFKVTVTSVTGKRHIE